MSHVFGAADNLAWIWVSEKNVRDNGRPLSNGSIGIRKIRTKLQTDGLKRDLALFSLAIDSKLRGCDVVAVRVVAPSKLMKRLNWIVRTFLYDQVWLRFRLEISHRARRR